VTGSTAERAVRGFREIGADQHLLPNFQGSDFAASTFARGWGRRWIDPRDLSHERLVGVTTHAGSRGGLRVARVRRGCGCGWRRGVGR
jgi:hypothetical protein